MQNKIAVVTGGTRGIGRAIIEKLSEEGFNICTCARNQNELDELSVSIKNLHAFKADLSNKEEVLDFANFVNLKCDHVDILVNNTGFFIPGEILNEQEGNLELMINTNLYSAYHLTRAVVPSMINNKSGHVFNMCSVASITAYPNGGSYCISKFALYGMSKVLREEMKPHGIRVTSILPGATYTSSWDGVDVPEERMMKALDVADSLWAAYALSESSVIEDLVIRPQLGDL